MKTVCGTSLNNSKLLSFPEEFLRSVTSIWRLVKGHDFNRADEVNQIIGAFVPEPECLRVAAQFQASLRRNPFPNSQFRNHFRNSQGSSLVEVALVMPIFTLLLVCSAEMGRLAYCAIEVTNAAYAGASYGAESHATAADTTNIQLAATTDGSNIAGLAATTTTSCSCSNGTEITCAAAVANCASPARIEESVQVNTTATVSSIFHYPGVPTSFTLHGQSILRVVQ